MRLRILFIIVISLALQACSEPISPLQSISGKTMGTTYSVKYVSKNTDIASAEKLTISENIETLLLDVNQLMSTYIEDSELSRLNQTPANQPVEMSDDTLYVIKEALALHALSAGKLDITVGPLVNLWGFGPQNRPDKLPTSTDLAAIREYVGVDKFSIEGRRITKLHNDVYIDLSTIAKGYAVDQIAELLINNGINDYLVEIGGEMRLSGTKPHQQDWLVAIEKPITQERAYQRIISIGDNAIASSGDYRNYFEQDGVRYSHLIDPATGKPITHNLVSVTVIDAKSIIADGLATALIVMGKEKGMDLALKNGIAALFITKEGDEFVEYTSTKFDEIVKIVK